MLWKWGDGTHVHLSAEGSEARTRVGDGTAHCGGDGWVSSLTLSPDDLYLVSAHDGPSQSYLVTWDVSGLITGDDIVELFRAPVPKLADAALFAATVGHTPQTALSFSADGRLLFSVHFHGSRTPAAGAAATCAPMLCVWEWTARLRLLQVVDDLQRQRCFWQQYLGHDGDGDGSGGGGAADVDAFPNQWPRALQLVAGPEAGSAVLMGETHVSWWTFSVHRVSQRWTLECAATYQLSKDYSASSSAVLLCRQQHQFQLGC